MKFATSSAEEVLTADIRICWCGGARSNGGTISRTTPRRRLCGNGARRTGSTSVGPEVTVLLSTGALTKMRGTDGIRPTVSCTNPAQKRPVLDSMMELRNQQFESASLQRRVCEPSTLSWRCSGLIFRSDRRWALWRALLRRWQACTGDEVRGDTPGIADPTSRR